MKNKGFTFIEVMVVLSLVCMLIAICIGGVQGVKHQEDMIAQCMKDGKKQYECEAMIKPHETHVTVQHF